MERLRVVLLTVQIVLPSPLLCTVQMNYGETGPTTPDCLLALDLFKTHNAFYSTTKHQLL